MTRHEAHARTGGVSVAHDACLPMMWLSAVGTTAADVAAPIAGIGIGGTFGAADPHRGTRAGSNSASHLSVVFPPAADDATATTASAAATLAASSSPRMEVDNADGATAASALAADAGVGIVTRTRVRPRPPLLLPSSEGRKISKKSK